MNRVLKRMVLSAAALSPGVAAISVQEMALSFAVMLMGVTGLICVAAMSVAISPKVSESITAYESARKEYPSLLLNAAFDFLDAHGPDPLAARARLQQSVIPARFSHGFLNRDDQVAMILSRVMARWGETDVRRLSDSQALELWLIERVLRASPAEAGALAVYFASPNAVLAMRDQIANSVAA